jgi:hypothetical protein
MVAVGRGEPGRSFARSAPPQLPAVIVLQAAIDSGKSVLVQVVSVPDSLTESMLVRAARTVIGTERSVVAAIYYSDPGGRLHRPSWCWRRRAWRSTAR